MPSLPVPLPPRLMVLVEANPAEGGKMLPPLVSIRTPMALSTLVLPMAPLLVTELAELMVIGAVLDCWIETEPVVSMVMLPLVAVVSAVEVALEISVSACPGTAIAAASRAAAAAESIKRCLINSAS